MKPGRREPGGGELGGAKPGRANLGGANLGGMNLAASTLSAPSEGANPHGNSLGGTTERHEPGGPATATTSTTSRWHERDALQREDIWASAPERVWSWASAHRLRKLLGQHRPTHRVRGGWGKLPWGFSPAAATLPPAGWEAVVWGRPAYCSFVLVPRPTPAGRGGGFIKPISLQAQPHSDLLLGASRARPRTPPWTHRSTATAG